MYLDMMASWDEKLLKAAAEGNIKEVELCIKNRANLECRDLAGRTPLMLAAWRGHLEVVTYLVTHGSQLGTTDPSGLTPLMLAAWFGHLEVVTYLVTHGSQLDATSTYSGQTALHYAAEVGRIDVTKCLIDQGCSPWVKSKLGKTPYDLVTISRHCSEEKKEVMDFLKVNNIVLL
ncbi:poly [ADP-ribose] polymerase tankyrase-like [Mytilus trossulus]|uniref:poly [ADP-ribose] polymerase tankyrase-like n=1 Tax=Mytilus trossulus TaxID=6551 RepID=UPI0030047FCA